MKQLVLILSVFMSLLSPVNEPNMVEVRSFYEKASASKTYSLKLAKLLENTTSDKFLLYGYKGAALMIEAKHAINPFTKLSHFKKGKAMLEKAIQKDSNNIELRYVRLTIQTNTPSFMGYNGAIKTDQKFIMAQLSMVKDTDLKNRIVKYLSANHICCGEELNG